MQINKGYIMNATMAVGTTDTNNPVNVVGNLNAQVDSQNYSININMNISDKDNFKNPANSAQLLSQWNEFVATVTEFAKENGFAMFDAPTA